MQVELNHIITKMPYIIKKQGDKWIVYNKESGKTMGTHDSKEKANKQLKALYANMHEKEIKNVDLKFNVGSFEIKEADEQGKWIRIGGEVFRHNITSRNGITYRMENINEVDGSKAKFFMTHELTPRNVVGHVRFKKEGDVCYYDAKIRNTKDWEDVVEKAKDKMFEVSLDARYKKLKRVKEKDKPIKYVLEGMEMRGLCGVGVGGVPTNSIDYAIAEKFKKEREYNCQCIKCGYKTTSNSHCKDLSCPKCSGQMRRTDRPGQEDEIKDVHEKQTKEDEVNIMSEDNKSELLVKENEELKAKLKQMEETIEEKELSDKQKLVKKLCEMNEKLKEEELMEKSIETLEVMRQYEEENDEKDEEEEEDGEGEVDESENKEDIDNIVIEKETGFIRMSDDYQKKFNEDIRKIIP